MWSLKSICYESVYIFFFHLALLSCDSSIWKQCTYIIFLSLALPLSTPTKARLYLMLHTYVPSNVCQTENQHRVDGNGICRRSAEKKQHLVCLRVCVCACQCTSEECRRLTELRHSAIFDISSHYLIKYLIKWQSGRTNRLRCHFLMVSAYHDECRTDRRPHRMFRNMISIYLSSALPIDHHHHHKKK